ncbi:hypothetical protein D9758_016961 [Tetrapyrgos nigripes]|uniref:Uncharacterized protein n=1 Tax=Tetrapyrgos nigripes TaxID=182062 RepID=A0A8H5FD37_9AGAR|nr:hypothetical protein D9758_016961 [Tetrapyrgos nigripes]
MCPIIMMPHIGKKHKDGTANHETPSFLSLLICAEQSFWLMSQLGYTSFKAAFRDAWKMFLKDHQKAATLRSALGSLSNGDEQELVKIILENRLSHAHRQ